jgi:peptide/nickel transport system substrate-binding protein
MYQRKRFLSIFAGLTFVLFLAGVLPGIGLAAPAEKAPTAKEWAAKIGLDFGSKYWPTKPVRGGIWQTAGTLYVGLMNPNHWPVNDWTTISQIYDKLIWTDGSYKSTIPFLAESWKFLDPKTVIMKLRQGVIFHDGTPFNAESVKYQMDWIKDPANGAWTRAWIEPLEFVEIVDNYTVKFHFNKPWASFAGVMSNVPGYMISTKALKGDVAIRDAKKLAPQVERQKKTVADAEKEGNAVKIEAAKKKLAALEEQYKKAAALAEGAKELDNNPVGTGYLMFDEASPGNYVKLKRNPNWWFAKFIGKPEMPYIDGLQVSVIPDPSVRLANLRAGKLDYMTLDPSQYPMVRNDRSLSVNLYDLNWVVGMRFNHKEGPCKDIRVRKAISHALDRKALINGVAFGLGVLASGPFPYQHWAHNPNLKPVPYNPEVSKKLLAEAGYKNGLTIKGYMYNITSDQTMGEAIKAMLAKVGITWNVQFLDPAAGSEKLRKVDYDFSTNTWVWIYDPDLLLTGWYHPDGGFNFGRSDNKKVVPLIEAAREEVDEAKRTKMYWEIEKLLFDNYEDVYISYPRAVNVFPKRVQGWNNDMYQKLKDVHWLTHPLWFKDGRRQ